MMRSLFAVLLLVPVPRYLGAGDADWPQWRGPARDGHAAPQAVLQSWPEAGPRLKWKFEQAGLGYSSAALVDRRVYTLGEDDESCFAICLSAADGTEIWRQPFSRRGAEEDYNRNFGAGPRSTPTVAGEQVFCLSETGTLAALDRRTGQLQWKLDLVADYGGRIPNWGYSESPLVDGSRVLVTPGMSNFMIGLDRNSGRQVWQSQGTDAPAHYVSALKGSFAGTPFYVTASGPGVFGFSADTGELLFQNAATGNQTAVIPTPLLIGAQIYHTSDYGAGNTLLNLTTAGEGTISADSVYHKSAKSMLNKHGGVVHVDGVIYGFSEAQGGVWMAQDLQSGETLWTHKIRPNRSGSICYADGRLFCYNDKDATVYLVPPSREGWQTEGQLTLPQQTGTPRNSGAIWAHPVVADGLLILRDHDLIFAYDISR